ncbi:NB-ARC domain-containing protein [Flavobacterium sp. XS1P32]|uniref:NB-ARC domain-containing protein n=1 Tax=Flavobacterium sp. XS1P32 TaxID=3401726 RepID=UPI003AAE05E3
MEIIDIPSQSAHTIYNVAGGLHINNSPEMLELLNKQKQEKLQELYSTPFFEALSEGLSKKKLIERKDKVSKIQNVLEEHNQLIFYGEPGMGKTTILYQFAKDLKKVIYISVKDKSPISIFSYLINKIRQLNDEDLLEVVDIDQAVEWLQSSLQKTSATIIIDDCEQLPDTVAKIIPLQKFNNKFLFATRKKNLFSKAGVINYECKAFTDSEIKTFLNSHGKIVGALEFNKIRKASIGNPLYLFYLTNFQITSLPESLIAFQEVIWSDLSIYEQEILILISAPHFSINTIQLSEALSFASPLEFSKVIENLSTLVTNINGSLHIFHPTFKEFILDKIKDKGLLEHYLIKLGNYFLSNDEIIQATYLLIDIAPEKVDKYLFDVFPKLLDWGELPFAVKVIKRTLSKVKKNIEKGYLYYHLSHANNLLGNKEESRSELDHSIFYLEKVKNKKMLAAALIFKAADLVELGSISEATEMADKIFYDLKEENKEVKAPILVTLSKIYVDMSETTKAAMASKQAFEIFKDLGDRRGMISSLANLISSLALDDQYQDDVEKYGLQLLEIIKGDDTEFSIEVIVLNALTSIYRKKKKFESAKTYCKKAIELCQKYEMKDRAILNLINFGNILRDEKNIEGAKAIYKEALVYTVQYNIKKDEGRIYWILASVETADGNLVGGLEYAEKSFTACSVVNYYYGIANALNEKAEILELLGDNTKAAQTYEDCANYYAKMEQYNQNYRSNIAKAITLYNSAGAKNEANILTTKLIEKAFVVEDFDDIEEIISNDPSDESVVKNFRILFKKYFSHSDVQRNIIQQFLSFVEFCKKQNKGEGKLLFKEFLNIIIYSGFKAKYSYSILGLAIEQSEDLLSHQDLDSIFSLLGKCLPFLSCRTIDEEFLILVSINGKINLEIKAIEDELITKKLALSLLLLLHERPDLIITEDDMKEKKCVIFLLLHNPEIEEALKNKIPPKDKIFSEHSQSVHMGKADYSIFEMIMISPEFDTYCNLSKNPDGKGSMYFYVNTVLGLREHFYHSKIRDNVTKRKPTVQTIAGLLGYTDLEDKNRKNENFFVDLSKIPGLVRLQKK